MLTLTPQEFEQAVAEGIDAIPEKFLALLDNVAIVVADEPTLDQLRSVGLDPERETLLGLYEGVPRIERGFTGGMLPDKITIFQNPILEDAKDLAEVRTIVRDTVWHEIAHHFGLDEEEVAAVEVRRERRTRHE